MANVIWIQLVGGRRDGDFICVNYPPMPSVEYPISTSRPVLVLGEPIQPSRVERETYTLFYWYDGSHSYRYLHESLVDNGRPKIAAG